MQNAGYAAIIEGHADEQGTREYNLALGARRAAAVQNFLISQGVPANRLRTISYGKERPLEVCSDRELLFQEPPGRDGAVGRRGCLTRCGGWRCDPDGAGCRSRPGAGPDPDAGRHPRRAWRRWRPSSTR
jgi:hypothetical protein